MEGFSDDRVFDSGFGGLTVHRALIERCPGAIRLPWRQPNGLWIRPPIDVLNPACALSAPVQEGCTLAVVACNTASVARAGFSSSGCRCGGARIRIARNLISIVVPTIELRPDRGRRRHCCTNKTVRHHSGFCDPAHGGDRLLPHRDPETPSRHYGSAASLPRTCRLNRARTAAPRLTATRRQIRK